MTVNEAAVMDATALARVRNRVAELREEIRARSHELERLESFLNVLNEYTDQPARRVSGSDIDIMCWAVMRRSPDKSMKPSEIVEALREMNVVIEAADPARLVSTRLSQSPMAVNDGEGWRMVIPLEVQSA